MIVLETRKLCPARSICFGGTTVTSNPFSRPNRVRVWTSPARCGAEVEIVALDDGGRPDRGHQELIHEGFRREAQQMLVVLQDNDAVVRILLQQMELQRQGREHAGGLLRVENRDRVRLEGHHDHLGAPFVGDPPGRAEDLLMAEVHAIEVPDRQDASVAEPARIPYLFESQGSHVSTGHGCLPGAGWTWTTAFLRAGRTHGDQPIAGGLARADPAGDWRFSQSG